MMLMMRSGVCDYEDLSPEQVCLGEEMPEHAFLAGAVACGAELVFTMWLTADLIRRIV
jgi:hypothetical protein